MDHSVLKAIWLQISFTDIDGELADPTDVFLHVERPGGTKGTYAYASYDGLIHLGQIIRVSLGVYKVKIVPSATQVGVWKYDWQATGALEWYGGRTFRAIGRQVIPA